MGSDSPKTKKYSVVEGSKEHLALEELKKGQDNYENYNYFEANNHYIKSLLFNYDDLTHNNLSISLGKYCVNCLKDKKLNEIVPYSLMIEKDEKIRDSIALQLKNEYIISNNKGNYEESLKYLVQSYLIEPKNDFKENIIDLCYKDFIKNFKVNIENLDKNENIKTQLDLLSSKKNNIYEHFATYLNNKGADYSYSDNDIMAKKYIDLANLLSKDYIITSNENIANKNLKISKENEHGNIYSYDKEYEKDKRLIEILKNFTYTHSEDIIDNWIRENEIHYKKNNFSHIFEGFNNNSCFLQKLKKLENKSIDIFNSLINPGPVETSCVIGVGLKKILYIELDYKNWMINLGGEYAPSFFGFLLKIFKCGYTINTNLYAEININLKPKSIKDIFGYDYGVAVSEGFETPFIYSSHVKSKSLRDDDEK